MKITDNAVASLIAILEKAGLDPATTYFEFRMLPDNSVGLGFNKFKMGNRLTFGRLNVCVDPRVDMTGMVIDYGKIGDREGLIFTGEKNA